VSGVAGSSDGAATGSRAPRRGRFADRLVVARAVTGGTGALLRGRTLLAVLAIAFGIALGYAVELINRAAVDELTAGLALLSGAADLEVRGPRDGFDESLYPRLAGDADVAVASPVVEVEAKVQDRREPLTILGVDVFRAAAINPALVAQGGDRLDTLRPDTLFASPAALHWLGASVGDTVVAQSGLRELRFRIAGTAGAGSTRYAVMDIAAAQDRFSRDGVLTRIDLRLRPGVDRGRAQARVQALLPAGVYVAPPSANAAATERFSRAYRVNLDVLALVALFTGAMLVYATQTLAVVRRRPQFALLRTLGLTRAGLVFWVVLEAGLLGVVGAAVGLATGYGIAAAALARFGPDLGAGFFRGQVATPSLDVATLLIFAALGIVAAVSGSLVPAREAARAAPAAALKAQDADAVAPTHGFVIAWTAIALGVVAAWLPPVADLPIFGYVSIALILIGAILALPDFGRLVLRVARLPRAVAADLALAHLRATPGRFAATLAAIVASIALMVSMAIMVASFRDSLDAWLRVMLPAGLYVRAGTDSAYFSPADLHAIASIEGVTRAEFMRVTTLVLDPARPRVVLLARDIDPRDPRARLALVDDPILPAPGAPPPTWVSESVADTRSLATGDVLALPLGGRDVAFTVAGVFRDYARQQGSIVVERSRYRSITGDNRVNEAALWLAEGTGTSGVRDAIAAYAGGEARLSIATPADLRAVSLATFDRTFAVTYALEAAAVLIGLVGLSASLVAQTLARRREFGALRHLGMTRRQVGTMLAVEGAILATIGVVAGLGLGFAISLILIRVVNRQSFHWSMDLHVPWTSLALLAVALLALATLTARASAHSATSIGAVRAVREDW
jgi:putative ABC transport system permease protein